MRPLQGIRIGLVMLMVVITVGFLGYLVMETAGTAPTGRAMPEAREHEAIARQALLDIGLIWSEAAFDGRLAKGQKDLAWAEEFRKSLPSLKATLGTARDSKGLARAVDDQGQPVLIDYSGTMTCEKGDAKVRISLRREAGAWKIIAVQVVPEAPLVIPDDDDVPVVPGVAVPGV